MNYSRVMVGSLISNTMDKNRKILNRKNRHSISTIRSKSYGVICLSILFFYLIRPVLPFIEYALDKEYIAKNICIKKNIPGNCCQGKCYLNEQIIKNAVPLESNSDSNKKILQVKKVVDHLPSNGIIFIPFVSEIILNTHYSLRIIDSLLTSFFVPPKF